MAVAPLDLPIRRGIGAGGYQHRETARVANPRDLRARCRPHRALEMPSVRAVDSGAGFRRQLFGAQLDNRSRFSITPLAWATA